MQSAAACSRPQLRGALTHMTLQKDDVLFLLKSCTGIDAASARKRRAGRGSADRGCLDGAGNNLSGEQKLI